MKETMNGDKPVTLIGVKGSDRDEPGVISGLEGTASEREHPILAAARIGDKRRLKKLLEEKKPEAYFKKDTVDLCDLKYSFEDLLVTDKDGRTALHLAAGFGNHTTALNCVEIILDSVQVVEDEDDTDEAEGLQLVDKNSRILEFKDKNKETPLHLAIENQAVAVVSLLLENQANTLAKNKHGTEALELIYKQVPDAMKTIYDGSITLVETEDQCDHTSFVVNWGPVIGFVSEAKVSKNVPSRSSESSPNQTSVLVHKTEPELLFLNEKETQCIHYILKADKWGSTLLRHPMIKWYLYRKWKKISWFFWITFLIQMLWLSTYACIFVILQLNISELASGNCTESATGIPAPGEPDASKEKAKCVKSTEDLDVNCIWHFMAAFTVLEIVKEVYQMWVLRGKVYWTSLENILQLTFIGLVAFQYIILLNLYTVDTDVMASLSAIAIINSAILMIFQLGKTPRFGLQVAAFKKVFKSCAPHLPIFIIWFLGFGLAFWALFYNAEKSWTLGMIAIIAAMGTGELNAKENLENFVTGSFSLPELIHVLCILLFVIVIVTLYFNLLIGYAVTDLQVLLPKAESLQLANKLNTIYTIETFLVSSPGKLIVAVKCWISGLFRGNTDNKKKDASTFNPLDSIYVLPQSELQSGGGFQTFKFSELPEDQLKELKELAFDNFIKNQEENE